MVVRSANERVRRTFELETGPRISGECTKGLADVIGLAWFGVTVEAGSQRLNFIDSNYAFVSRVLLSSVVRAKRDVLVFGLHARGHADDAPQPG